MAVKRKRNYFLEGIVYLLYPFIFLLSHLPFKLLYFISDGITFILFDLLKYRRSTILKNLSIAFPHWSEKQKRATGKESIRNTVDSTLELIKSSTLSEKQLLQRVQCTDDVLAAKLRASKKPVLLLTSHHGNFDIALKAACYESGMRTVGVYKPFKNKAVDHLLKYLRKGTNAELVAMRKTGAFLVSALKKEETFLLGMVVDQSPKLKTSHYFTCFFDHPTSVFNGYESMARRLGLSVYYVDSKKVKRGHHSFALKCISENARAGKRWSIVDRYYELLEKQIKEQPDHYLWTHKRWKVTLDNAPSIIAKSPKLK